MKLIVNYVAHSSFIVDIPDNEDIKLESDEFYYYCNDKFIDSDEYNYTNWKFDSYNLQLDESNE